MIAFHVIVLVHGYNTNGFVRPLERNSDRQTQLKPISPKDTPPSYSVQSDKSFKRSIKSVRTLSAKRSQTHTDRQACTVWPQAVGIRKEG